MATTNKTIIGRLESVSLPELAIKGLHARVDTGAKTSSLHVDDIEVLDVNGKPHVQFYIHPDIHDVHKTVCCKAPISDIRRIKSSNGTAEERYVITTPICLGQQTWDIEITLTDRSDMSYLMLFGRQGMGNRFLVDPDQTFLSSNKHEK